MKEIIELYHYLSAEEKTLLLSKFGDMMAVKLHLSKELTRNVSRTCEEIESSKPYIHDFKVKELA